MDFLNFNYLWCFNILSQELSFTKTAEVLKVAQPAVSKQIKMLEESLGTKLFNRGIKDVSLTQEGLELKIRIQPLLEKLKNEMLLFKNQSSSDLGGTIRCASLREFGEAALIHNIHEFMNIYPQINIEIYYCSQRTLVAGIKDGKFDLAIGLDSSLMENIDSFKLVEQKSYLLTNPKSHLHKNLNEKELSFIAYKKHDPLIMNYLKKFVPNHSLSRIKIKLHVNSHESMISYLEKNPNYYAILPEISKPVKEALKKKSLIKAKSESLQSNLYLFHLNNLSSNSKVLKNYLLRHIAT